MFFHFIVKIYHYKSTTLPTYSNLKQANQVFRRLLRMRGRPWQRRYLHEDGAQGPGGYLQAAAAAPVVSGRRQQTKAGRIRFFLRWRAPLLFLPPPQQHGQPAWFLSRRLRRQGREDQLLRESRRQRQLRLLRQQALLQVRRPLIRQRFRRPIRQQQRSQKPLLSAGRHLFILLMPMFFVYIVQ